MSKHNHFFIFFLLVLINGVSVVHAMKKDASNESPEDFVDEARWRLVYSPRISERRNQQDELSPRTSTSKNSVNLQDYDPISANASGEIGESLIDDRIVSHRFDQEPQRAPIQVTIIKNQEGQPTSYKPMLFAAAATMVGVTGFALGWFSHYINNK